MTEDQYLNDGANLYHGPIDEFVVAASDDAKGSWKAAANHARVTADGLKAIRGEVSKQTRRRQKPLA